MISSVEPACLKLSESGELATDDDGIAIRGLLVRHLVLPENIGGAGGIEAPDVNPCRYMDVMKTAIRAAILFIGLTFAWDIDSMEREQGIDLPEPLADGNVSVEAAIHERRSLREFSKRSLTLASVAQLLWATQGVTSRDGGRAAQNVYLQAAALGLGTVIVGAFEDTEVQEVLGLPADHAPLALMPVGHPR